MTNQSYTKEFKINAVEMVLNDDISRSEVGRRLEVSPKNISRWVKEYQESLTDDKSGESKAELKRKIKEQEKEIRQLKMEQDILKKAAAFFAKDML